MYTMKDEGTLRKGFLIAGIVVLPVIFLTGMFGILAVGMDAAENPSVAMISFVKEVMPFWSVVALLVLGIVLVMSSMDTMLNGITSTITVDIARTKPEMGGSSLLRSSRAITVVLILPAIFIASKGYSVLYLFLIADLVCAAAIFPVFYGLYSKHLSGTAALISSIVGLTRRRAVLSQPRLWRVELYTWGWTSGNQLRSRAGSLRCAQHRIRRGRPDYAARSHVRLLAAAGEGGADRGLNLRTQPNSGGVVQRPCWFLR